MQFGSDPNVPTIRPFVNGAAADLNYHHLQQQQQQRFAQQQHFQAAYPLDRRSNGGGGFPAAMIQQQQHQLAPPSYGAMLPPPQQQQSFSTTNAPFSKVHLAPQTNTRFVNADSLRFVGGGGGYASSRESLDAQNNRQFIENGFGQQIINGGRSDLMMQHLQTTTRAPTTMFEQRPVMNGNAPAWNYSAASDYIESANTEALCRREAEALLQHHQEVVASSEQSNVNGKRKCFFMAVLRKNNFSQMTLSFAVLYRSWSIFSGSRRGESAPTWHGLWQQFDKRYISARSESDAAAADRVGDERKVVNVERFESNCEANRIVRIAIGVVLVAELVRT